MCLEKGNYVYRYAHCGTASALQHILECSFQHEKVHENSKLAQKLRTVNTKPSMRKGGHMSCQRENVEEKGDN